MPNTICPRCQRRGFVRKEHVIKAGEAFQQLYCGACDYSWSVSEQDVEARDLSSSVPPKRSRL